jgi:hypothetical protein
MTAAARARPSPAGTVMALALLVEGAVLRAALDADDSRAYFFGRPIELVCGVLARTGIPCPMCGITRALAFALRGELGHAFRLNPAAPIAVVGLFLVAVGLLTRAGLGRALGPQAGMRFGEGLRRGAWIYAAIGAAVWIFAVTGRAADAFAMR